MGEIAALIFVITAIFVIGKIMELTGDEIERLGIPNDPESWEQDPSESDRQEQP